MKKWLRKCQSSLYHPLFTILSIAIVAQVLAISLAPQAALGVGIRVRGGGFALSVGQGELESEIDSRLHPIAQLYGDPDDVSLAETIANIIKAILGLLGIIFIALMVYAGFMWMTAAGNEDRIKKAKTTIAAAIVGVAIVLAAFLITTFVIDAIVQATTD